MQQVIAVIGPTECEPFMATMAEEVGVGVANMGCALVTGGRGGVMEAASKGAKKTGGLTMGFLPANNLADANAYLDIAIPTGLGQARNVLICRAAHVVIAVGGGYGTLSEIAHALKMGKMVVGLATWDVPGVHGVESPDQALQAAAEYLARMI